MITKTVLTHCYPTRQNPYSGTFVLDWMEEQEEDFCKCLLPFKGNLLYCKSLLKIALYLWVSFWRIRSLKDPIIVHWWLPLGILAVLVGKNTKVICHGSDIYWLKKHPRIARWTKFLAKRVKSWQFVSQHVADTFREVYGWYPRFNVEAMPIKREVFVKRQKHRDKLTAVTCGALIPRKRMDLVITYLAARDHFALGGTLVIIGDGPQRIALEDLCQRLHIRGQVRFTGNIPAEEVAQHFNRCREFYLFSEDEGLGLVILEAKACGCKTIVTPGDGKQEIADVVVTIKETKDYND